MSDLKFPLKVYFKAKPSKVLTARSQAELECLLRVGYAIKEAE